MAGCWGATSASSARRFVLPAACPAVQPRLSLSSYALAAPRLFNLCRPNQTEYQAEAAHLYACYSEGGSR